MNLKRQSKISSTQAQCRDEKGLVLIAAIALMAILALVAIISVTTTHTDIKISSNYKTSIQASYAAQAGIEEARARLRGLSDDDNYIGDTIDDPFWAVYVGTSSSWKTTDDPDYNDYTPAGVNSIQSDISYWAKVRHKKWSDCTATEKDTIDTSNTSGGTPGDPDIIYYGYATLASTTLEQFTSDNAPPTASPVDIITSYGSSGTSLSVIEVQTRQNPGPPIPGAVYGNEVEGDGNITIIGNDYCSSYSVPAVAHVDEDGNGIDDDDLTSDADAGKTIDITPALDLAVIIDELESIATVTLTGDQTNYSVGSDSDYEVVYCNHGLNFSGTTTGFGTLVAKGDIRFNGNMSWNGLIITSGEIEFNGSSTIYGAILSADKVELYGAVYVHYDSCEIDNAKSSFQYATFRWEDKKLD
jgi:hypothetical protein